MATAGRGEDVTAAGISAIFAKEAVVDTLASATTVLSRLSQTTGEVRKRDAEKPFGTLHHNAFSVYSGLSKLW